ADRRAQRRSRRSARQRHHPLSVREVEGRDGGFVTIHRRVTAARERLREAGISHAELDARLLAQHVLGWTTERFLTDAQSGEPDGFAQDYESVIARRGTREPLPYIVGARG